MSIFSRNSHSFSPLIAFRKENFSSFYIVIIAIMAFIASILFSAGMALYNISHSEINNLKNVINIQILGHNDNHNELIEEIISFTDIISQHDDISIKIHDKQKISDMVAPWIGDIPDSSSSRTINNDNSYLLPYPTVIEITVNNKEKIADIHGMFYEEFSERSNQIKIMPVGGILSEFNNIYDIGQIFAFSICVLIFTAIIALIAMSTRSNARIHQKTIMLLHRLGAYDGFIIRQFQIYLLINSMKGALLGLAFAVITIFSINHILSVSDSSMLEYMGKNFEISTSHILYLLALITLMALSSIPISKIVLKNMLEEIY